MTSNLYNYRQIMRRSGWSRRRFIRIAGSLGLTCTLRLPPAVAAHAQDQEKEQEGRQSLPDNKTANATHAKNQRLRNSCKVTTLSRTKPAIPH